jgi:hypothetical protein
MASMSQYFPQQKAKEPTKIQPTNAIKIQYDHIQGLEWDVDLTLRHIKLINDPAAPTAWILHLGNPTNENMNHVEMIISLVGYYAGNTITFVSNLHDSEGRNQGSIINNQENGGSVSYVGPSQELGICYFLIKWFQATGYLVQNLPLQDITPYELVAGNGIDISGTFPEKIVACTHEMVAGELHWDNSTAANIACADTALYYLVSIPGTVLKTMGTPVFTTAVDGKLNYIAAISQTVHIAVSACLVGNGNTQNLILQLVRQRGVVHTALGDFPNMSANATDYQTIAFHRLVSIEQNDILYVNIRNSSSTGNVSFKAFNLVAVGHYHPAHVM